MSNTYSAIISSKWYCFNQRVVSDVIDYNHSVINLTTTSVNITNTIKMTAHAPSTDGSSILNGGTLMGVH